MKETVLKLDESRRPIVIVHTAGDDTLRVKWRPTHEKRHRHRHCAKTLQLSLYISPNYTRTGNAWQCLACSPPGTNAPAKLSDY